MTTKNNTRLFYVGSTIIFRVFTEDPNTPKKVSPSSGVTLLSMILHGGDEILVAPINYTEVSIGQYELSYDTSTLDPGTYTIRYLISGDEGSIEEQDRFVIRQPGPTATEASSVPVKISRDLLTGVTDPDSLLGKIEDFYIKSGVGVADPGIWGPKTAGGWGDKTSFGQLTPATYTITNDVAVRAFDANATTLEELADVVATLILDLGGT